MNAHSHPKLPVSLVVLVAALTVLASVLFVRAPAQTEAERQQRYAKTRRDLKPTFDEMRDE